MRAVLAAALFVAGCAPGLELSIDLRSDLRAGDEVDVAELRVERAGATIREETIPLAPGVDLYRGVRLADVDGLASGIYRVRVVLRRAGLDVAQRSVAFALDGDLAVTVAITRACPDDACEPAPCASPAECALDVPCLRAECALGRCFAVPDDRLCGGGRCDPRGGCGPPEDGGVPSDAGPPPDGAIPDAGGACDPLDCASPACAGQPCDDGDPCTHTDRCAAGACAGTAISCTSTDCVMRACDGSSACVEMPRADGAACTDDGNECTADVCRSGACAHERRADGHSLGGFRRCCGGAAVDTSTNRSHCGACGLACASGFACVMHSGAAMCDCTANTHCQGGVNWLCSTSYGLVCACTSSAGCPGTSRCLDVAGGPNYCQY